jgi:hypothetical protein
MATRNPLILLLLAAAILAGGLSMPVSAKGCAAPHGIKQGMDYNQARSLVLNGGFQSNPLPAYGYSATDQKVISDCATVNICNAYPEIDSCGTGHCKMTFHDAHGNRLSIFTYGELSKDAAVTNFEVACKRR